jgi:hypothetical protein
MRKLIILTLFALCCKENQTEHRPDPYACVIKWKEPNGLYNSICGQVMSPDACGCDESTCYGRGYQSQIEITRYPQMTIYTQTYLYGQCKELGYK